MHCLENKPGMVLIPKSLFHVKPVVHFPKTLTCCEFCRLVSHFRECKGRDVVNL